MGREVRRVPADWKHPKISKMGIHGFYEMRYQPMYDRPFASAIQEWVAEWQAWERGEYPSYCSEESKKLPFWEYSGPPPNPDYHRPDWKDEERTHYMMYEDTSEGTPISPAFETPEELARWLADTGASSFDSNTAPYEAWLKIAKGGWAPSMIVVDGVLSDGVNSLQK